MEFNRNEWQPWIDIVEERRIHETLMDVEDRNLRAFIALTLSCAKWIRLCESPNSIGEGGITCGLCVAHYDPSLDSCGDCILAATDRECGSYGALWILAVYGASEKLRDHLLALYASECKRLGF